MAFKRTQLAVILAVVGLTLGAQFTSALQCWECTSSESWAACSANATQKICPATQDRCGKTKLEFNSRKYFRKACGKTDTCETICEQFSERICSSECCEGDLCNGDEAPQQCFECKSLTSMEDCEKKAIAKTCSSGQSRCSESMATSNSSHHYAKECATQEVCGKGGKFCEQWQKQGKDATCMHRCCSGRLCNSADASGSSLKCFSCDSTTSWEDCEKRRSEETCPYGKNRCITVSTKLETKYMASESYKRACVSPATCENQEATCTLFRKTYGDGIKCNIDSDCCSKDLCNAYSSGTSTVVSIFTLLSCAVRVFLDAAA